MVSRLWIRVAEIKNVQDRIPYYVKKVMAMRSHVDKLPPILVWEDRGDYYLANGTHRLFAHLDEGRKYIDARVFDSSDEAYEESRREIG